MLPPGGELVEPGQPLPQHPVGSAARVEPHHGLLSGGALLQQEGDGGAVRLPHGPLVGLQNLAVPPFGVVQGEANRRAAVEGNQRDSPGAQVAVVLVVPGVRSHHH